MDDPRCGRYWDCSPRPRHLGHRRYGRCQCRIRVREIVARRRVLFLALSYAVYVGGLANPEDHGHVIVRTVEMPGFILEVDPVEVFAIQNDFECFSLQTFSWIPPDCCPEAAEPGVVRASSDASVVERRWKQIGVRLRIFFQYLFARLIVVRVQQVAEIAKVKSTLDAELAAMTFIIQCRPSCGTILSGIQTLKAAFAADIDKLGCRRVLAPGGDYGQPEVRMGINLLRS